jgi:IS605 OrfB family transposase
MSSGTGVARDCKRYCRRAVEQDAIIAVGDLCGIRKYNDKGLYVNDKTHKMFFVKLLNILEYKAWIARTDIVLVNETTFAIVIPLFPIARRIVLVVFGLQTVVEGVGKLFQNLLSGLHSQSVVVWLFLSSRFNAWSRSSDGRLWLFSHSNNW